MSLTQRPGKIATLAAALLGALASCVALPIPVAAQSGTRSPIVLEQYLSRARLDPGVVGARAQLTGFGARVLHPVVPPGRQVPRTLASRLAVGGFLTYAPADDHGVTVSHYGATAELRLTDAPVAGRVEPLLSVSAGAFRTRQDLHRPASLPGPCVRPLDLVVRGSSACLARPFARHATATDPAVSPAVGARVALFPNVALRTDVRDVVVYRGAPRHNLELALGFSVTR